MILPKPAILLWRIGVATLLISFTGFGSPPAFAQPATAARAQAAAKARAIQAIRAGIIDLSGMSKSFTAERLWLTALPHSGGYRWQARVRCVASAYQPPRSLLSLAAGRVDARGEHLLFTRLPAIP